MANIGKPLEEITVPAPVRVPDTVPDWEPAERVRA